MHLDQSFHDGQPQPQSASRPLQATIPLNEHVKDPGQQRRLDADPGIADGKQRLSVVAIHWQPDVDLSSPVGETPGVIEEAVDDLC